MTFILVGMGSVAAIAVIANVQSLVKDIKSIKKELLKKFRIGRNET